MGIGVRAANETDTFSWKKFNSGNAASSIPRINITYDSYPATATNRSTVPATACVTGSTRPFVNTATPTLKAAVSDPDGGSLYGNFDVWPTGGAASVWSGNSAAVSSGAVASATVASGKLVNGSNYSWRVHAGSQTIKWEVAVVRRREGASSRWDGYGSPVTTTVALLANPLAGRGRGARLAGPVRAALAEAGLDVLVLAGDSAEHSTELAAEAVTRGIDGVVAIGGDGLVHCAIQALAGTRVPLGIVPAGAGNDLAGTLGIPTDPRAAVGVIVAGATRAIDLGRAGTRWWATVLCAGFDSTVIARAERIRWPRGPRRYDLATWLELVRLQPHRMRLTLDGEAVEHDVTLVAVGNGDRYGGGMLICPTARLDDGLLDVTVGGAVGRVKLARLKPLVRTGRHVGDPSATVYRAREVTLDAPGVAAYADGERIGPLPVSTRCMPAALRVFVPPDRSVPAAA
ncbi:MAG TPA: YegS/Rv2252/BmrU family lipid kinase [Mycobacteriales bacterium]|nr:YegS/Rv2252/BmrU family lipid kinase [Mycobacteriales bacterium]